MSLRFEIPESLTTKNFITLLRQRIATQQISREKILATSYDSFDWRLYANGITAERLQTVSSSFFLLKSLENSLIIASAEITDVPVFSNDFRSEKIRHTLAPLLAMRALIPICTFEYQEIKLAIRNQENKIILRITIEEYEKFNNRIYLQPLKGYKKAAKPIIEMITGNLGFTEIDESVLTTALKIQGSRPLDYSSKLNFQLIPDMRADTATKTIFRHLLKTMKANEQGTLSDTDSEFLHDFRVAIRRTRTGLSQLKSVFPDNIHIYYGVFFSWLGQITSPTRDLDVYLLNFTDYRDSLPSSMRDDINPLYDFLVIKKQAAQQELVAHLGSSKYRSAMAEWESYLNDATLTSPCLMDTGLTIELLANKIIWKNHKRVLSKGSALTINSPEESFHELRKSCKKLRYLIEFFQSLYPQEQISILIKKLKDLQDVLGAFQDYQVQQCHLKMFSQEMLTRNLPVETFLAMGVLIQNLENHKYHARKQFESRFEAYQQIENELPLKALFSH
ncbi:MAG: CHAD domain-containing protein [Methylococcaceae bacterium]|nr:CHAD domain-containing protein [Methylococcaceae bacterium]